MGYLATVYDQQPFINSNLFVYDAAEHAIYMHTAYVGRTPANVTHNPRICFTVTEMGRLLPAHKARNFSVEYAGVVVFGTAVIVEDPAEARRGLQLLMDKYAPHLRPGFDYDVISEEEMQGTAVYRISIDHWSGKRKAAETDFPGAFAFGMPPAPQS